MSKIAVEVVIDAPVDVAWEGVESIASHVDWMQDAESITFLSEQHAGVGTRFECRTVVGPFKLTDVMEITEWQPGKAMGVTHQGLVAGTGMFTLRASGSSTVFSWVETLRFPWYFGGPLGAAAAQPVLKAIWKGNLRRLKSQIESAYAEQRRQRGTQ